MLEQAIIDAEQLKETAKQTAEEAVIEKYQIEIKEAVEKILEQDELDELDMEEDAALISDGEGEHLDLVDELPSAQLSEEDEVINIDLNKLEEMMEEELENGGLNVDEMASREDLAEKIEDKIDEEVEISEEELEELAIADDVTIDENDLTSIIAEMLGGDLEIVEEETEEVVEEAESPCADGEKEVNGNCVPASPTDLGREVGQTPFTELQKESRLLTRKNNSLLREQTRTDKKVQLLKEKVDKYGTVIKKLKDKLNEGNLTNAKLLYQNRILNSVSLNERQKDQIVEAISNATTVEEAKIIFETLQSAVGVSKKRRSPESLNEVVTRSSSAFIPRKEAKSKANNNAFSERMKILAGLK